MPLPTDWYFELILNDTRSSITNPPAGDPNQNPNPQAGSGSSAPALLHMYQYGSGNNYQGTVGLLYAPLDLDQTYWPADVSYNANGPSPNFSIRARGLNTFLKKRMGLNLDGPPVNPPAPPYILRLVGDWDGAARLGSGNSNGSGAWMSGQWLNWTEDEQAPPPASSSNPHTCSWYLMQLWDARPGQNRYLQDIHFLLAGSSLNSSTTVDYGAIGLPGLSTPPADWPDGQQYSYWGTNQFVANSNANGFQFQIQGPATWLAAALGINIPGNQRFQFWATQSGVQLQGTATVPPQWLDSGALAPFWQASPNPPPVISGGPSGNNMVWTTADDGRYDDYE